MKFAKMQGCGNDYVYINGFEEKIDDEKKPELVRWLSERHFGIGSDGVIFINPSILSPPSIPITLVLLDIGKITAIINAITSPAKIIVAKIVEKSDFLFFIIL